MKADRFGRRAPSASFSGSRREMLRRSGGLALAGAASALVPGLARSQAPTLGIVSFPGPSISSHSKVIITKNGFDKKNGWDLRWEVRPTTEAYLNDFVNGAYESIDFAGLNQFANLFNKGVPLKIVQATVHWPVPVVVRTDSGIKSIAELKGKRIAVGRASFTYAYVNMALRSAGIDLEKDTTYSSVDFFQALPRLQRGDFDAAVLLFEHAIKLMQDAPKDFRILFDASKEFAKSLGVERCYQYQAVRTDWLQKNGGSVAKVIATYNDVAQFFASKPAEAVKLLAQPTANGGANLAEGIGTVEYVTGTLEGLKTIHVSKTAAQLKREITLEMEAYLRLGLIEKIPAESIFA
jgi:ABC-type nitrate/sulfonate/bicarbonate transport system substrate-binding protein